ncbi:MAG TPA: adenylyl-sulfate kinase, partial [Steroidobacteraceae bacterium]|nr:adenylyl-sulfate kinase [Steroidobacteraceae bacterium]
VDEGEFIEIHVDTALEVCKQRDPKGLYARALAGKIKNFTGIDSPYEAPEHPEIVVDTGQGSAEDAAQRILEALKERQVIA